MKNWLWFLGISVVFVLACQEKGNEREKEALAPSIDLMVDDTPHNPAVVQFVDSQGSQRKHDPHQKVVAVPKPPQDTQKRYPIIHIGDKDFDPNKYLGPDATESQRAYARKMIAQDSLRRVRRMNPKSDSLSPKQN
jgi:hypothetical protein